MDPEEGKGFSGLCPFLILHFLFRGTHFLKVLSEDTGVSSSLVCY